MSGNMVKPKAGLQLRKIGSQYMIVKVCDGNVNMSDVFTLNETAARLWEKMAGEDCTPEGLAGWLCEEYEVDGPTAVKDIERQLDEWKRYGLLA